MNYMDHSATTKPRREVLDTFLKVNEDFYGNPASIHEMGVEANELLNRARSQIATLLGTEDNKVIFTSGGTESNHFSITGIAKSLSHRGRHILTSKIEHPSVLETLKQLEKEGFEVEYLDVNEEGIVSLDILQKSLRKDTVLISIMHINNEIGSIQPIAALADYVKKTSRAIFHVDAIQSFGKYTVTFQTLGVDILSISGHKLNGLKGTGIVAWSSELIFQPVLVGGAQEFGLRSGTVAVPQAVSLAKAMRLIHEDSPRAVQQYEAWSKDLREFLAKYPSIKIISPPHGAVHILTFSVRDIKGEVIVNALQNRGIIVSTSSACSSKQTKTSHVIEALHISDAFKKGVIRISFGYGMTDEHIKHFKENFSGIMKQLKGE
ncbi:MAG: cysteine desulfurase family protein [Paenisporosarcina sp.]